MLVFLAAPNHLVDGLETPVHHTCCQRCEGRTGLRRATWILVALTSADHLGQETYSLDIVVALTPFLRSLIGFLDYLETFAAEGIVTTALKEN